MRKCNLFIPKVWLRTDYCFRPFRTCYLVVFCSEMFFDLSFCLISCDLLEIVSLNWRSSKLSRGLITTNHRMMYFFFNIFTRRTLTLLTILILYLHTFAFTLHCSYSHYLYKQTGQTLTLLIILALYLHLHCSTHTSLTLLTPALNYNTYNTISNHLIRLQLANLQFSN